MVAQTARRTNPKADTRNLMQQVDETTPLCTNTTITYQESFPAIGYLSYANFLEKVQDGANDPEQGNIEPAGPHRSKSTFATISVMLIGVFISQADTSLVLATYGQISSEFQDLDRGSWLLSSYMLAMCVSQPFFGKLSDVYGRKRCLQSAYLLFAIGTLGSGLGMTMGQVIVGRAVQGAGGAGMVCMVSILLTDLLPLNEVALYRSYVNVFQTIGRSCGGVVGGFLASRIGWRWAFLVQIPPTILSIFLVQWKLQVPRRTVDDLKMSALHKLRRIDFTGAFFLSLTILTALFLLDTGGQKYAWTHPIIITCGILAFLGGVSFCVVERFYAKDPIFPMQLLTNYVVVTSYAIILLQNFSQTALMFIVPIYFQVTLNASTGDAGAYLIPAIVGNAIGGLITGTWIKRTGRYKFPTCLASASSCLSFTLLIILWRGHTSIWESFVILPAGFAVGMSHSAVFIGLTSGVAEEEIAIAGSGLYLSGSVGGVTGVSGASTAFQIALRLGLKSALSNQDNAEDIIHDAMSDINYIQRATGELRHTMMPAYVSATRQVFKVSLIASIIAFAVGTFTREKRLLHNK